jgi:hypothetical protein
MDSVNEKSTYIVTVSFFDENNAPVTPTAAWYSLYCETTGKDILTETALTGLGTTKDIEITPTQNTMSNPSNLMEQKLLTLRYTYGTGKQGTAEYRYQLLNLVKII